MSNAELSERVPLTEGQGNQEPQHHDHDHHYHHHQDQQHQQQLRLFPSFRLLISLMAMFAFWLSCQSQTSLGAAMVCMVSNGSSFEHEPSRHHNGSKDNESRGAQPFATFKWDKRTQGWIFALRFMAYYFGQLPSGYLKAYLTSRAMCALGLVVMGTFDILFVPVAYYNNMGLIYLIRFMQGIGNVLVNTAIFDVGGKWYPKHESTFLNSIFGIGYFLGGVVVYALSSIQCQNPFLGWPSIFYLSGGLCLTFSVVWWVFTDEDPSVSRWVKPEERDFILQCTDGNIPQGKIPLRAMLRSGPLYAIAIIQIAGDWTTFFAFTVAPAFFTDILLLPQSQSELACGLPFLVMVAVSIMFSRLMDHLRLRRIISTLNARRLAAGIAALLPAVCFTLLAALPASPETAWVSVAVYALFVLSFLGHTSSWEANILDVAPTMAGPTAAVSQTLAVWTGFVVPLLVDYLTVHNTKEEWNTFFYITVGVQVLCFLGFCLLASGDVQPWALSSAQSPTTGGDYEPLYE